MTKIIEKTVVDKYAPRDTNVSWLDVSGDKPIKKYYINGKWVEVGDGGAGSSNPTEADATKVWQVTPVQKGIKTGEIAVAPMQTININYEDDNSGILQNVSNLDKFVGGAEVTIIFDGAEYNGIVEANPIDSRMCAVNIESANFSIFKLPAEVTELPNDILTLRCDEGEYSVSVNIIGKTPIYDYNWAPGVKIPIPTAEDKNKILVVNKVEVSSEEYELAPTQTVTITEGDVVLQNTSNLDKFVKDAAVTLVLNGTAYTGQVINASSDLFVLIDAEHVTWELDLIEDGGESGLHLIGALGTYEVSVSVLGKEYSYEYQLQSGGSGGSEKVVTLENWAYTTSGGESVLTDIDGNKFYEGQDFTIQYNTGVLSGNPFDVIKTIGVRGNYQCDKIVIIRYDGKKYIKIPVCIFADSGGNNYAVFGSSNSNYIGILIPG